MNRTIYLISLLLLTTPLAVSAGGAPFLLVEDVRTNDDGNLPVDLVPLTLPESQNGRYIVGFYELPQDRTTYAGERVVKVDEDILYFVVESEDPQALSLRARLDDRVRYLEPDAPGGRELHFTPNDALYGDAGHYGSKIIGGEAAWDRTLGSTAVKVAMIDSGINHDHEDHQDGRVLQGFDFYNNDSDPEDSGGACGFHGTHTSGTAGATINNGKGIAGMSQHSILPIKIFQNVVSFPFQNCLAPSDSTIADAIKFAGDQGAHVSSNSWGGGADSTAINDAIAYSHNKGVHHVASAGNGQCNNCVSNPWNDVPSIATIVTATDSSDGAYTGNSKGPEVDVSAPGVDVLSTTSGTNGYSIYTGTSMAAPHVSGTIGLMKALDSTLDFATADQILKDTAVDLGTTGKDDTFGYGRINADAATAAVAGGGTDPQCSDGIDNDGDGLIDHPDDPGCDSTSDNDETDPVATQCSDGIDNDGDGLTDFPDDPGCTDSSDDDETDPVSGGDTMHVHFIDHSECSGGRPANRDICITVDIFGEDETGESNVDVCVTATRSSGGSASGCGLTDASGRVVFVWTGAGRDTYTTCVDTLTKLDVTWDTAADHEDGGNCGTDPSN